MRSIYKKWSIHPSLFFIQFFFQILVTYSAFLHKLIRLPFSSLSAFSSNSLFLILFASSMQRFTKNDPTSYFLFAIFPSSPFVLPSIQSNSTPLPHLSSSSSILIPWISFSLVSFAYHSSPSSGTLFIPFCSQSSTLSVRLFSRHCSSALLMGPLGRGEHSRLRVQRQRVDGKLNFVSARAKITRDSARKTPLGPYEDGIFNFHRGEPLSRDCLPARSYGKYTSILASSAKSRNFERFRICQPSD